MADPKIIVLGSLEGKLSAAFSKLSALHAKNRFTLALITGNPFSTATATATADELSALLAGTISVPLPTYFTRGSAPFPRAVADKIARDEDICDNLHYLPPRALTKTLDGVRLFALGDSQLDASAPATPASASGSAAHTIEVDHPSDAHVNGQDASSAAMDAHALRAAYGADILVTAAWPVGVWNKSRVPLGANPHDMAMAASQRVADVCNAIRPRYHFTTSPGAFFWEREPYVNASPNNDHDNDDDNDNDTAKIGITRFISMAPFGNQASAKAMYAFALPKAASVVVEIPNGSTSSPFFGTPTKRRRRRRQYNDDDGGNDDGDDDDNRSGGGGGGFSRFATSDRRDGDRHHHHRSSHKRRRHRSPPPGPDRCFFCLSNPNLSSHMVSSIGDESYLATAKGPLVTSKTYEKHHNVGIPCHFIVTPLAHQPTIAGMEGPPTDPQGEAARAYAEMARFRTSLDAMISAASNHSLGTVAWEISRADNIHVHWQLMAVPVDKIRKGLVEAAFQVEAENCKYPRFQSRELDLHEQAAFGDYFRVWIRADDGDSKVKGQELVMPLDRNMHFDLQFGRKVLAKLLGLERWIAWRDCVQSRAEEEADVEAFRKSFAEWDFTLAP